MEWCWKNMSDTNIGYGLSRLTFLTGTSYERCLVNHKFVPQSRSSSHHKPLRNLQIEDSLILLHLAILPNVLFLRNSQQPRSLYFLALLRRCVPVKRPIWNNDDSLMEVIEVSV